MKPSRPHSTAHRCFLAVNSPAPVAGKQYENANAQTRDRKEDENVHRFSLFLIPCLKVGRRVVVEKEGFCSDAVRVKMRTQHSCSQRERHGIQYCRLREVKILSLEITRREEKKLQ